MFTYSPQIHQIDLNSSVLFWSGMDSESRPNRDCHLYEPDANFSVGFIF